MRWPRLVAGIAKSTPCTVKVDADGIDEDGAPVQGGTWEGACNWQDSTLEKFAKGSAETELKAKAYVDGDPFPSMAIIAGGTVTAFGESHRIARASKARNLDGTVNHTLFELA